MIEEKKVTLEEEEWRQILLSKDLKQIKDIISKAVSRRNKNQKKLLRSKQKNYKKTGYAGFLQKQTAEEFRKDLIKGQTEAEKKMKAVLKSLNIKYDFQKVFYTPKSFYIVDFYLNDFNVVIEVDGGYHNAVQQKELDKKRTEALKNLHIRVYRVTNYTANNTILARKTIEEILRKYETND